MEAAVETSAAALQAGAGAALHPAPDWILEAERRGWKWALISWNRAASVPGAWFDAAKADRIVKAWPTLFNHTEDRWAGKPFHLAFWQEIIVRMLVGWKRPIEQPDLATGKTVVIWARVFRELRLWVPRKAGKSEFLAALAILFWLLDGVIGAQGFCFASSESQARIVFQKMDAMLAYHPALSKPEKVRRLKKAFWAPETRSSFELLPGKVEGRHGLSPTTIVGDEMHEWRTRDIATTLRQGTGARLQPMELYASTAGIKTAVVGYELFEETRAILEGRIDDSSVLAVLFYMDDGEDWSDEKNLLRVNPNMPVTPSWEFIRRELALAKERPSAEAHFRRYHANQWVDAVDKAIPIKIWDACPHEKDGWKTKVEKLRGRRCTLGFDLSSTRDLTSLVAWFEPLREGDPVEIIARFWCPEEAIDRRARMDRVSYDRWSKLTPAVIEPTPGNMIDQAFVQKAILEWCDVFDVRAIGFDPFYSLKLITDLQADGIPAETFVKVRQGHLTLSEPWRRFEELVFTAQLDHGGNPCLRWMAGNVCLRPDANMNFVPDKSKSAEKIDGIAAALNAYAAHLAGDQGPMQTGADALVVF